MPISRLQQVPPGSLDLLAGDVRRRRSVQRAWFALAEAGGYQEVIPPTFEYEEVFTRSAGPELASRLIRFVDRDGALVALRADFTSSIARMVATRLAGAPLPLRLAYAGKVYRQEPEGVGRRREIFQLGAELIGDASAAADVEALRLVVTLARELGIGEFQINLGDIRFIRPLLQGLAPEQAEALRTAIDRKDRAALAAGAREIGAPAAVARALVELPELIGRGEVLGRARSLATGAEALGYYTGIQFELFVAGVGRAVGYGGRYDDLLALYGADRPAVGFALETDALADLVAEVPA